MIPEGRVICPACWGIGGGIIGFPANMRVVRCNACHGLGDVTPEVRERMLADRRKRADRGMDNVPLPGETSDGIA